jgi:hypothetical protein
LAAFGTREERESARIRPIAGHCQTKFYTACSGTGTRPSSTIFAHELLPRSASFEVENIRYLFALTSFFGEDDDASTAKTLADSMASSAVVAAIAPICVDQFQRSAEAANNLTALKKTDAWQQATFVEKGGWAMMPGSRLSIPACRKPAPPFSAPRNSYERCVQHHGRRSA